MKKWDIDKINRMDEGKGEVYSIRLVDTKYREQEAYIKWDGCIDFRKYWNDATVDDVHSEEKGHNCNYIHICDIDDMIKRLQELKEVAKEHFSESNYENYWKESE